METRRAFLGVAAAGAGAVFAGLTLDKRIAWAQPNDLVLEEITRDMRRLVEAMQTRGLTRDRFQAIIHNVRLHAVYSRASNHDDLVRREIQAAVDREGRSSLLYRMQFEALDEALDRERLLPPLGFISAQDAAAGLDTLLRPGGLSNHLAQLSVGLEDLYSQFEDRLVSTTPGDPGPQILRIVQNNCFTAQLLYDTLLGVMLVVCAIAPASPFCAVLALEVAALYAMICFLCGGCP